MVVRSSSSIRRRLMGLARMADSIQMRAHQGGTRASRAKGLFRFRMQNSWEQSSRILHFCDLDVGTNVVRCIHGSVQTDPQAPTMTLIRRRDTAAARPNRTRIPIRIIVGLTVAGIALFYWAAVQDNISSGSGSTTSELLAPSQRPNLSARSVQSSTSSSIAVAAVHDDDSNLEPIPRPPLKSIVQGWNITGDPSWLLQFSIVGFPKSGTSTLMFHLKDHPEIHIFKDERCELAYNQQARLIEDMYRHFPAATETQRFVRGIKCPLDLESPQLSMTNYRKFFPKTDFIVGIRHPVLWYVRVFISRMGCHACFDYRRSSHSILFHRRLRIPSKGSKAFTTLEYIINMYCLQLRS